ncbi:uncharacterized protein CANTADRAFT_23969 [Suhomyces tanzawaensis NRRL Y-17324]|uniref:AD domain-containing protein n=1 Tax=Suhomyces tanzawaensis NRRL Y-17324 TaxID=984487 RepID=A0A1E4SCF7_9ASCO|nr:uncharacterized protein CANTADRAFT_23969 [Suhomyces tanzawaensis NRRL Y-17324]ODV77146.1 hypothetical protein CANTADRAFT_23969 [Suhomyces tanzawaensis NRRL Y-17324]
MSVKTFNQAVNTKVKVTTLLDQTITGYIYTFSSSNEVLALKVLNHEAKKANPKSDTYRIINTSFIKSIQVLPPYPKKGNNSNVINKHMQVNYSNILIPELERSLNAAIQNYKPAPKPEHNNSNHITNKLFDKLKNKFGAAQVKKAGNDIILFNEIKLSKPYTLAKLTGTSTHTPEIQKALKEFWLEDTNEKRGG